MSIMFTRTMSTSIEATKILDEFLPDAYSAPTSFPAYTTVLQLKEQYPNHQHLFLRDAQLPLVQYLASQGIECRISERLTTHAFQGKLSDELTSQLHIGVIDFVWMGTAFQLFKFRWPATRMETTLNALVFLAQGETKEEKDKPGIELITKAYKWNLEIREEIWCFSGGCWTKDSKLYQAIQTSDWDSLVFDQAFIDGLKRDTETFFSSKEIYRSLGITWKRGLLLLGPPGNGKTEAVKVLLKEAGIPALYVKSFRTHNGSEAGIRAIFEFARQEAPCILVLEDLDSMVVPEVRAFFLNELDGLEQNDGILTIATSNHPERIDSAILNRPSRFDVKYTFGLPSKDLRKLYIEKWTQKATNLSGIKFSDTFMEEIAQDTDGFSFAFMKELFVSFLLRVAHDKAAKKEIPIESLMRVQVKELKVQIEMGHDIAEPQSSPQRRGPMRTIVAQPMQIMESW